MKINPLGIGLVLLGAALLICGSGALPFALFGMPLGISKTGDNYQLKATVTTAEGIGWVGYKINSIKINGVEVPIVYPTESDLKWESGELFLDPSFDVPNQYLTGTQCQGYQVIETASIPARLSPSVILWEKNVGLYVGTNTIEVKYETTAQCNGGVSACMPSVCDNPSSVFGVQTFTDTFTNPGTTPAVCGNAVCEASENFQTCPTDCEGVIPPVATPLDMKTIAMGLGALAVLAGLWTLYK